jgi:hypothetical protein
MIATGELPDQEIVRRLRLLRFSPDNRTPVRGGRKIPLKRVAEMAGVHRITLYRAIWGRYISANSRAALSHALIMLQTTQ